MFGYLFTRRACAPATPTGAPEPIDRRGGPLPSRSRIGHFGVEISHSYEGSNARTRVSKARMIKHAILLAAFVGFGNIVATRAQAPAGPGFTLNKLGPNVWAAIDNPKAKAAYIRQCGLRDW